MELSEVLLKRRSVRKFTREAVSDGQIDALLHAAMSGPSACNARPWAFYVVSNETVLQLLRQVTPYTNMNAALAMVVCGDMKRALPEDRADFWVQDCSAATENILLRAADLGLGTVWCGIHPKRSAEKKVAEILELDETKIPLNIIFIGHPAECPDARDQYEEDRVRFIR